MTENMNDKEGEELFTLFERDITIERPETVFKKNPYYKEQWDIFRFADFIIQGSALIEPQSAGMDILEPAIQRMPMEHRIKRINESLTKARQKLNELGV